MKKSILLSVFLLQSFFMFGQDKYVYCELAVHYNVKNMFDSKKFNASIFLDNDRSGDIYDENNRYPMTFYHNMDAVNFMANLGWELMQVYVTAGENGTPRYVLRRKQTSEPIETFLPRLKK
ncbi:MAG: hypothetical protein RL757_2070 [Bacteroidota bacterium]|jgi:hypothetical protein